MGLILAKVSVILRITIPLDLSTMSFIPLPGFIRSRHPPFLLTPSLVLFPQNFDYVSHDVPTLVKLHQFPCAS